MCTVVLPLPYKPATSCRSPTHSVESFTWLMAVVYIFKDALLTFQSSYIMRETENKNDRKKSHNALDSTFTSSRGVRKGQLHSFIQQTACTLNKPGMILGTEYTQ